MNNLQESLAELLNKANNGIASASEFLLSELPEVIQQLLLWHMVESLITSVVGLVFMFIAYRLLLVCKDFIDQEARFSSADEAKFALSLASIVVSAIIAAVTLNLVWLKIWVAPKVWLIEYTATLAGGK